MWSGFVYNRAMYENETRSIIAADRNIREWQTSPPYVSFTTFRTLLDWLKSEGVPLRFDRSFWHRKFSGSVGTQLVASLRFLGLLQEDRPLSDLESLANAPVDERRFILAVILKDSYKLVSFDQLGRATPSMIREWFKGYAVEGNTLRKAISFFVTAAKEAEMPMSNSVMKMSRGRLSSQSTPASGKKRQEPKIITKDNRERRDDYGQVLTSSNHQVNNRTSIKLDSGGHVALELAVDLFDISEKDREFVLRLVDLTREYKQIYGNDPIRTDETG